jgi:hypothetical protein
MFRKFLKQKPAPAEEVAAAPIDLRLLEEHLDSIKVSLLEIRSFRKKKIAKTPTYHYIQRIDIEEAWPSCRDTLQRAYGLICDVANSFHAEYEVMVPSSSFGSAIDQFANLIDRITLAQEETGEFVFSQQKLHAIDDGILNVQKSVNLIRKHVMVDFVFTRNPSV